MASGHVKWFNDAKGFGFIIPDDQTGADLVHFSSIVGQSGRTLIGSQTTLDTSSACRPRRPPTPA